MNQSIYKKRIEEMNNPKWFELINQIEDAKKLLANLRKKKAGMIKDSTKAKAESNLKTKIEKWDQDEKALRMAKDGRSVTEISNTLRCSEHTLPWRIERIWRRRFAKHYNTHRERTQMGLLTSLRESPPIE